MQKSDIFPKNKNFKNGNYTSAKYEIKKNKTLVTRKD